jgi:uncharacterized protein YbjT (DUF2867 family)
MKKKQKKAVIFGSSGLTGFHLLQLLCNHPGYGEVVCYNRKPLQYEHSKFKEIINDFTNLEGTIQTMAADEVYCCLGTTIKKAGSREAFRWVDFDLPVIIGKLAQQSNVNHYFVVSSIGAQAKSGNFYLRIKGEMEEKITKLAIRQITVVRPSMLLGDRKEHRFGEEIGKVILKILTPFMLGKLRRYRGIAAKTVAKAMIIIANSNPSKRIFFESEALEEIVRGEA